MTIQFSIGTYVPSSSEFISRYLHACEPQNIGYDGYADSRVLAVRLGDWIYIDGGQIWYNADNGTQQAQAFNCTLAIDMRSSWTNSSVPFTTISRGGAPLLNQASLWPTVSEDSFYKFGGQQAYWLDEKHNLTYQYNHDPWKFTPDNQGSGRWDQQQASESWVSSTVPGYGLSAYGNGLGFYLGGTLSLHTFPSTDNLDYTPLTGMVEFNSSNAAWRNLTSKAANSGSAAQAGQGAYGGAAFAPNFGPEGIAIFFGVAPPLTLSTRNVSVPGSMTTISIFEPRSQTWYNQTAAGPSVPLWRGSFCMAGVEGDDGTFEIIMHGGTQFIEGATFANVKVGISGSSSINELALDQIYILSLPSFAWFQAPYVPIASRSSHTCHVVGPGNGQLLTVGGANFINSHVDGQVGNPDVFTQGLGVFDLNRLQWVSSYNASAEPYRTPQMIKDHITAHGHTPAVWDDPALATVFGFSQITDPSTTPTPIQSGAVTPGSTASKHPSPTVVGGIIGGIFGCLLIFGIVVLLWRWEWTKSTKQLSSKSIGHSDRRFDFGGVHQSVYFAGGRYEMTADERVELPVKHIVQELPTGRNEYYVIELPGHQLSELRIPGPRRPS